MSWFVYILLCANGSYYVGHSNAPKARFSRHKVGSGARHTAQNHPEKLLYSEEFPAEEEASPDLISKTRRESIGVP